MTQSNFRFSFFIRGNGSSVLFYLWSSIQILHRSQQLVSSSMEYHNFNCNDRSALLTDISFATSNMNQRSKPSFSMAVKAASGICGVLAVATMMCLLLTMPETANAFPSSNSESSSTLSQRLRNIAPPSLLHLAGPSRDNSPCDGLSLSKTVFADMHDGDQKQVSLEGTALTIEPVVTADSDESWIIRSTVDLDTCTAMVDFDVPGKPSPPPVPLLLTFWTLNGVDDDQKTAMEFTDPSGTIAPSKTLPLNLWVELV